MKPGSCNVSIKWTMDTTAECTKSCFTETVSPSLNLTGRTGLQKDKTKPTLLLRNNSLQPWVKEQKILLMFSTCFKGTVLRFWCINLVWVDLIMQSMILYIKKLHIRIKPQKVKSRLWPTKMLLSIRISLGFSSHCFVNVTFHTRQISECLWKW